MKDMSGNGLIGDVASIVNSRQGGRSVLILVPRSRVDLYQALKRSFADDPKAKVILDRRFRERRVRTSSPGVERRKGDRRHRTDVEAQLSAGRSVTVPIFIPAVSLVDPDARAILSLCCRQHVIACQKCQSTYRLGWLPRSDSGLFSCPLCGFDITSVVAAHTETCSYWVGRTPSRRLSAIESPPPPAPTTIG